MKKIITVVPRRVIHSYQCETCGTKYSKKEQAQKCEARIKEKKFFKKGDLVKGSAEYHACNHTGTDLSFLPKGKVIRVIGPILPDYEYEVKWLGAKAERLNGHIYLYEVEFPCKCRRVTRYYLFRSPELKLVKVKNR